MLKTRWRTPPSKRRYNERMSDHRDGTQERRGGGAAESSGRGFVGKKRKKSCGKQQKRRGFLEEDSAKRIHSVYSVYSGEKALSPVRHVRG